MIVPFINWSNNEAKNYAEFKPYVINSLLLLMKIIQIAVQDCPAALFSISQ